MRAVFAIAFVLVLGCSPAPSPSDKASNPRVGNYSGHLPSDGEKPEKTVTSGALAEALGGYKLALTDDGRFLLEARGRVLEGKFESGDKEVTLTVERVFGMTRNQLMTDRNRLDNVEADLKWFDKKLVLKDDGKDRLRLDPSDSDGETVVFTRDLPKN